MIQTIIIYNAFLFHKALPGIPTSCYLGCRGEIYAVCYFHFAVIVFICVCPGMENLYRLRYAGQAFNAFNFGRRFCLSFFYRAENNQAEVFQRKDDGEVD